MKEVALADGHIELLELLRLGMERLLESLERALEVIVQWLEKNIEMFLKTRESEVWERQELRREYPVPRAPLRDQRSWHHDTRAMSTRHYMRRSLPSRSNLL